MNENHCHCHHEHHEEAAPSNIYEQAFAKYDLHLHDEHVSEAVHRLVNDRCAEMVDMEARAHPARHRRAHHPEGNGLAGERTGLYRARQPLCRRTP